MRITSLVLLALLVVGTQAYAGTTDPQEQMESLLKTLQAGKYDGDCQAFFTGSQTAKQKATELRAMDGQLKAAFEFYGSPNSWETVETKKIGNDLVNIKILSKQKDEVPLFWNALFYRRHKRWEPIGVVFFDDPKKAGFY